MKRSLAARISAWVAGGALAVVLVLTSGFFVSSLSPGSAGDPPSAASAASLTG